MPTFLRVKGLAWQKVVQPRSTNFTRCSTCSAFNDKISGQMELKKLKLFMCLVNYFHYVSARIHPNPIPLRVNGLARQKMVKPKSKNFTRCSIYSASYRKILSQGELKKMKLCMQFSHLPPLCVSQVSAKSKNFHDKRGNEENSGQTKKHKSYEMLDLLCLRWQNLESRGA